MTKLLEVKNLTICYKTDLGVVNALNDVSISVEEGKTFGLVGETGAGKTTLAKGIMRLTPIPPGDVKSGQILYNGKDLMKLEEAEIRKIRGKHISMIFQDPMTSLNPVMTVGDQIAEVVINHENISVKDAYVKTNEMLELVEIPSERSSEYPHQFSGGMKQRVIIAMALACNPKLLIADEPTTALDVTIQAQVLEMMKELKNKFNTSVLLITHDLGVVAQNCDDVAVIYAGEVVESGTVRDIFKNMKHPYTEGLFASIPNIAEDVRRLKPIDGLMPDPTSLPKGCKFHTRCKYAQDVCRNEHPKMTLVNDRHIVRCFIQENLVSRRDIDEK